MTDAEILDHARKALQAWQQFVSHGQVLFPEHFDTMEELVPGGDATEAVRVPGVSTPPVKDIIAIIGKITGWP